MFNLSLNADAVLGSIAVRANICFYHLVFKCRCYKIDLGGCGVYH